MDKRKTLVLLRNGSIHGSVRRSDMSDRNPIREGNKGTFNPDDVLCVIPKPSYKCIFVATIIQFFVIIAGCVAFGIYYTNISKDVTCTISENIELKNNIERSTNSEIRCRVT